jgi:hypothetical protein
MRSVWKCALPLVSVVVLFVFGAASAGAAQFVVSSTQFVVSSTQGRFQ